MGNPKSAKRIIEIHNRLVNGRSSPEERSLIISEQRDLWDREFPGAPFERVARTALAQITA